MNINEHLLQILGEEGAEIAQAASKANRFGLDDVNFNAPDGPDSRARLVDELNDLYAVVEMLVERGVLPATWLDRSKMSAKKAKVFSMMEYARRAGTLADAPPSVDPPMWAKTYMKDAHALAEAARNALAFLRQTKADSPQNGAEDEAWQLRMNELEAALKPAPPRFDNAEFVDFAGGPSPLNHTSEARAIIGKNRHKAARPRPRRCECMRDGCPICTSPNP